MMQPIRPNYNWENGVKKIEITKGNLSQSCILCQSLRAKTLVSGSKCIKQFFLSFSPLFILYLLCGCDLCSMSCLFLDILCPNPLTQKTKLCKQNVRKHFVVHQKYFMAHQYMPKVFYDPHKNPLAPSSYIVNVRSLMLEKLLSWRYSSVTLVDLRQLDVERITFVKFPFLLSSFCSINFSID